MRRRGNDLRISFFSFQDIIMSLAGIMIFIALLLVLDITTSAMSPHATDSSTPNDPSTPTADEARQKLVQLQTAIAQLNEESRQLAMSNTQSAADDDATIRRRIAELEQQLDAARKAGAVNAEKQAGKQKELAALLAEQAREAGLIKTLAQEKAALDAVKKRVLFTLPDDGGVKKEVIVIEVAASLIRIGLLSDGKELHRVTDGAQSTRESAVMGAVRGRSSSSHDVLVLFKPSAFNGGDDWIKLFRDSGYRTGWDVLEEDRSSLTD